MVLGGFLQMHSFSLWRLLKRSRVHFSLEMLSRVVFLELVPRVVILEMELISRSVFFEIKLLPVSLDQKFIAGRVTLKLSP